MLKTKFKFGQKVLVSGYISRHRFHRDRKWVRFPFTVPIQAIFLGGRKLADGQVEFDDDGCVFCPERYLEGALVCQYNRNPIKVLLEDCRDEF